MCLLLCLLNDVIGLEGEGRPREDSQLGEGLCICCSSLRSLPRIKREPVPLPFPSHH